MADIATPEQIAAAWGAWRVRHKGSMGPGPGFVEAINAALAASPAATEIEALRRENQELRKALEDILAPIAAAQRDLKPDQRLNGDAYRILNSVANLRDIARRALMSDIPREQLDRAEGLCPRPCNDRPADFSMRDCIEAGECGCIAFPEGDKDMEVLKRERDEARQIVRDIHWMARRYADGRNTYAPGMYNDAVKKAIDAGWLNPPDDEPAYAADGSEQLDRIKPERKGDGE